VHINETIFTVLYLFSHILIILGLNAIWMKRNFFWWTFNPLQRKNINIHSKYHQRDDKY